MIGIFIMPDTSFVSSNILRAKESIKWDILHCTCISLILEIVSFLSSSIYSTLTSVSTTNSVSSVQHFTYVIPTTVRPSSTSNIVRTTTRGSTTSQTRPDPTVAASML